jgi:hypothetical protein
VVGRRRHRQATQPSLAVPGAEGLGTPYASAPERDRSGYIGVGAQVPSLPWGSLKQKRSNDWHARDPEVLRKDFAIMEQHWKPI